jgi:Helix-hairpin-helix domain
METEEISTQRNEESRRWASTISSMSQHPNTDSFPKVVPQPAIRALTDAGFEKLEDLAGASEAELLKLHGVGPKAIRIIQQALIDEGQAPLRP